MKMRMNKIFCFIIVLFVLSVVSQQVAAQAPTPTPDPCSPDAPLSVPCPVERDSTNVVIPLQQTWISNLFNSINEALGQPIQGSFDWNGTLQPLNGYHTGSDKFSAYSQQLQQASDTDLNPAALQDIEKHDEQPKKFTMTAVECVIDIKTGQVTQYPSIERVSTSEDIPGLKEGIEGSRRLGSFVTGYTQTSQDYNLKNIIVSLDKVACETPSTGEPQNLSSAQSEGQNTFTNAVVNFFTTIIAALLAPFQNGYAAQVTQYAQIQGKGVTPWIHNLICLGGGCTASDVSSVTYDPNKEQVVGAGGAVAAMYKPAEIDDSYKVKLNAADTSQEWNITGKGSAATTNQNVLAAQTNSQGVNAAAVNFGQARVTAAGDYMNCTLMPAEYQNRLPDGAACNKNWVNPSAITPGAGNVCAVASAYNIPCCQLQGVMELETGTGTYMGSESCSTNHGTFQCCHGSGCGPAGVLCGQYNAFAGNDNLDLCSPTGAAELLARAMLLKLCQADGKCDSYNWTKWGDFVKVNYSVPDGDYTATAYFYGLTHGCGISACSQYRWGPGKGYCDAVASYCTTGKIIPDNTSPQFCAACNEEIIRAHQNPIQCP
jgi:hypothetical protein